MTDPRESCSEGWDPAELLAYLEGDLAPKDVRKLEEHLRTCLVCSAELKSLRQIDLLLKRHPESFHPEKEALFRVASTGEDNLGKLQAHVDSCPTCKEELEILREMIALRESSHLEATPLPAALAEELERLNQSGTKEDRSESLSERLLALWRRLFAVPNSLPLLTVGTAAAVVIIAVLAGPLWRTYLEQQIPESVAVPAPPASKPAEISSVDEEAVPRQQKQSMSSSQDSVKHKKPAEQEPRAQEAGSKQTQETSEARKSNMPSAEVKGFMQKTAPAEIATPTEREESYSETPAPARQQRRRPGAVQPGSVPPSALESRRDGDRISPMDERDRLKMEKKASAAKSAQPAIVKATVEVRIVDAQGRDIEDIAFVPPSNVRFGFHREIGTIEKERAPAKLGAAALEDRKAGDRIIIKVTGEGGDYDLEGQLFLANSTIPDKTVRMEKIPKDDLTRSIQDLVSSLVAGR